MTWTPFVVEFLDLILAYLAVWVYGTEDRPRHPVWRNSIRIVAFSGLLVSAAWYGGVLGSVEFPYVVILIWAICSLIVLVAEYDLGSKKVCLAAFIAFPIGLAIAIYSEI